MKSSRPWIDTPLLCPSTCLSPASFPLSLASSLSGEVGNIFDFRGKKGRPGRRKVEGKQRGECPKRETIIAEFSRFTTRSHFLASSLSLSYDSISHFFISKTRTNFKLTLVPSKDQAGDDSKKISKLRNFCLIRAADFSLKFLRKFYFLHFFLKTLLLIKLSRYLSSRKNKTIVIWNELWKKMWFN